MVTSIKLCLLYTTLVIIFNMLDKKRLYNNLIFLTILINVGSVFLLNIIDIVDATFSITLLIINRNIINVYFKKSKKIKKREVICSNIPVPLIISGDIRYDSLRQIKKNSFWLIDNMEKNHLELQNVYYAFYMDKETYFIKQSINF